MSGRGLPQAWLCPACDHEVIAFGASDVWHRCDKAVGRKRYMHLERAERPLEGAQSHAEAEAHVR